LRNHKLAYLQRMTTARLTVWYDGTCPLCLREIALMRRLDRGGAIVFVDIGNEASVCPLDRQTLLARFHAQEAGGPILSGAAAFGAMWRALPTLSLLGQLARIPPVLWLLERAYRLFLKLRPWLQNLVRRLDR
jgi:predicted DCC family thiol-disulfide oxidoreductase YuxK